MRRRLFDSPLRVRHRLGGGARVKDHLQFCRPEQVQGSSAPAAQVVSVGGWLQRRAYCGCSSGVGVKCGRWLVVVVVGGWVGGVGGPRAGTVAPPAIRCPRRCSFFQAERLPCPANSHATRSKRADACPCPGVTVGGCRGCWVRPAVLLKGCPPVQLAQTCSALVLIPAPLELLPGALCAGADIIKPIKKPAAPPPQPARAPKQPAAAANKRPAAGAAATKAGTAVSRKHGKPMGSSLGKASHAPLWAGSAGVARKAAGEGASHAGPPRPAELTLCHYGADCRIFNCERCHSEVRGSLVPRH